MNTTGEGLREALRFMTVQELLDQDPEAVGVFEELGIYEMEVTCTNPLGESWERKGGSGCQCGFCARSGWSPSRFSRVWIAIRPPGGLGCTGGIVSSWSTIPVVKGSTVCRVPRSIWGCPRASFGGSLIPAAKGMARHPLG